jgi:hypothetical protein
MHGVQHPLDHRPLEQGSRTWLGPSETPPMGMRHQREETCPGQVVSDRARLPGAATRPIAVLRCLSTCSQRPLVGQWTVSLLSLPRQTHPHRYYDLLLQEQPRNLSGWCPGLQVNPWEEQISALVLEHREMHFPTCPQQTSPLSPNLQGRTHFPRCAHTTDA